MTCLLTLPEDLLLLVLQVWVTAEQTWSWKALSALDVAACAKGCRAHVLSVLSKLVVVIHSEQPEPMELQLISLASYQIRDRVSWVTWAETRNISLPVVVLTTSEIVALASVPLPLLRLEGLMWEDTFESASNQSLASLALPLLLDKMPCLIHLGVTAYSNNRQPFLREIISTVVQSHGPHLRSLHVGAFVDDILLKSISSTCYCLEDLELTIHTDVSPLTLLALLRKRGPMLRRFHLKDSLDSAPLSWDALETLPPAQWWTEELFCAAMDCLSHPDMVWFSLDTCEASIPSDLFLHFLATHPFLRSCTMGAHSYSAACQRAGLLILHRLDSGALDRALRALAAMSHLPLQHLLLRLRPSDHWMASPSALVAFTEVHGAQIAELELSFLGIRHTEAFPILQLTDQLPYLRRLNITLACPEAMDAERLVRCLQRRSSADTEQASTITELRLSIPDLTDPLLTHILRCLPSIEELELFTCPLITDEGLAAVAELCPGLVALVVEEAELLTEAGLERFAAYCPSCSVDRR